MAHSLSGKVRTLSSEAVQCPNHPLGSPRVEPLATRSGHTLEARDAQIAGTSVAVSACRVLLSHHPQSEFHTGLAPQSTASQNLKQARSLFLLFKIPSVNQLHQHCSDLQNQNLSFDKIPGWFGVTVKAEKPGCPPSHPGGDNSVVQTSTAIMSPRRCPQKHNTQNTGPQMLTRRRKQEDLRQVTGPQLLCDWWKKHNYEELTMIFFYQENIFIL